MVSKMRQKTTQTKKNSIDVFRRYLLTGLLSLLPVTCFLPARIFQNGILNSFNQKMIHKNKIRTAAAETIHFFPIDTVQINPPLDAVHRTEIILEEILLDKGFKIHEKNL